MWICGEPTQIRSTDGEKWYADGTFFSVSGLDHFAQLYIISNKVTWNENSVTVVPKIFALLQNNAHKTYEKLLNNIESIAGTRISPSVVSCDFEMAIIKTTEKKYPEAIIQLCRFHFYQSVR